MKKEGGRKKERKNHSRTAGLTSGYAALALLAPVLHDHVGINLPCWTQDKQTVIKFVTSDHITRLQRDTRRKQPGRTNNNENTRQHATGRGQFGRERAGEARRDPCTQTHLGNRCRRGPWRRRGAPPGCPSPSSLLLRSDVSSSSRAVGGAVAMSPPSFRRGAKRRLQIPDRARARAPIYRSLAGSLLLPWLAWLWPGQSSEAAVGHARLARTHTHAVFPCHSGPSSIASHPTRQDAPGSLLCQLGRPANWRALSRSSWKPTAPTADGWMPASCFEKFDSLTCCGEYTLTARAWARAMWSILRCIALFSFR